MKQTINLYLVLPKIESPLFASKRIWSGFGLLCLILILWSLISSAQYHFLSKKVTLLDKENSQKKALLDKAQSEAIKNQTADMIKAIAALKNTIVEKKELIGQIPVDLVSNLDDLNAQLTTLSKLNIPQIQLTSMTFTDNGNSITFTGFANNSLAVLYFIKRLKNESAFKGTYFSVIAIGNKEGSSEYIPFTVSSTPVQTHDTHAKTN